MSLFHTEFAAVYYLLPTSKESESVMGEFYKVVFVFNSN